MDYTPETLLHPWEDPSQFADSSFGIGSDRFETELAEPLRGDTPLQLGGTTLRFVFWPHAAQYAKHASSLLYGCDILAVEAAVIPEVCSETFADDQMNDEYVQTLYEVASALINGSYTQEQLAGFPDIDQIVKDPTELDTTERAELIRKLLPGPDEQVLIHFIDRLEQVVKLDVDWADAPQVDALYRQNLESGWSFHGAVSEGRGSWDELRSLAWNFLETSALYNSFREGVTVRKLEQLALDYPDKTIGVLYGNGHDTLTRQIDFPGVRLQRYLASTPGSFTPILEHESAFERGLQNCLRTGIQNESKLDQFITLKIITRLVPAEELREIDYLSDERLKVLTDGLQTIWAASQDKDLEGKKLFDTRQKATSGLMKSTLRDGSGIVSRIKNYVSGGR